ncbi:hypothetical protein NC652_021591 [Populus alba x Populus x berolinensis]|nr:hypothetical protein NC652_021591 [Populus alba x Populus x berolinensis]
MRLNHDPMLIIEYFLWRTRSEYAISNHYDRHYVWEESDGLSMFDPSDLNTRLPSCIVLKFNPAAGSYALQTCLKVRLLSGPIQQCQIYFHAPGIMKLIDLLHVIN